MTITMVGTFPPIKGISEYCVELACALSRRVAVDFVSFSHIYPERLYPGGTRELAEVALPASGDLAVRRPLAWFNPLGWLWAGLTFPGRLLHVNWWTYFLSPVELALMAGAKLRRIPVVMTVHNVLGHETNALDRALSRIAFGFPDRFIVHTEDNRGRLVRTFGIRREHVAVVPYGPLEFYADAPVTREEARRKLGLSEGERVVLYFGYIREYKGLDVLLRALPDVARRVPDVRLVVAGTCWGGWEKYRRLIDELGVAGRCRLDIGYVPSSMIKVYFRAADVLALPYLHFEAQSGPGNIALAFGTPIVVTRTGGLPALVRDERAVVPPGDADALARALVDCLTDPQRLKQMSADSRALAHEYSWDSIAEKTVAIYETLAKSSDKSQVTSDK
jgi:glycosyltransferase involved in cell wall biosynthesis